MKSAARLYAVQALFQMEAAGQQVDRVAREFEDFRFGLSQEDGAEEIAEGDSNLFRRILDEAVMWQAKITQATDRALKATWPDRPHRPGAARALPAAGAEMVNPATPIKVVINEFVEVARAFFPEGKETKFVNAGRARPHGPRSARRGVLIRASGHGPARNRPFPRIFVRPAPRRGFYP